MTKVALLTGAIGDCLPCRVAAAQTKTVWDGVYSEAQAGRGKKSYITNCARATTRGSRAATSRRS